MQSEVNLKKTFFSSNSLSHVISSSVWKCVAVNANAKQIMKINTEFAVE